FRADVRGETVHVLRVARAAHAVLIADPSAVRGIALERTLLDRLHRLAVAPSVRIDARQHQVVRTPALRIDDVGAVERIIHVVRDAEAAARLRGMVRGTLEALRHEAVAVRMREPDMHPE